MASTMTSSYRRSRDHFEPQDISPEEQRRLRGQLEQIDYAAFISNREVIGRTLGQTDMAAFQRLAVAAANARGAWVAEAVRLTASGHAVSAEQAARLGDMRKVFEELSEAYEAMRRMVERGYLAPPAPPG
ncbi:hypothetical protein [Brevundimonas sp.]|uniref:hypothetical protein n=1 Tax=Brevundimonas sp. TaxID=1871086 RepID=UPI001D673310|nr:hypothetical protein [Brevundimonas sp.]MBA4000611.1 hypothetical protein [Brevundimonas sp.]